MVQGNFKSNQTVRTIEIKPDQTVEYGLVPFGFMAVWFRSVLNGLVPFGFMVDPLKRSWT